MFDAERRRAEWRLAFVLIFSLVIDRAADVLVGAKAIVVNLRRNTIIVGEVCSGLRSLISLMAVGAIYAYLQEIANLKRTILFLSIIPISIIANICESAMRSNSRDVFSTSAALRGVFDRAARADRAFA